MKIYISYRRGDTSDLVDRFRDKLIQAYGEQSVQPDLADIPIEEDFRIVLNRLLDNCNVMLVIIGPEWTSVTDVEGNERLFDPADYTRIEVETGIKRIKTNDATVIPVLFNNTKMPSAQELPESLHQLTFLNAVSIRDDPYFDNDIERVIRDVRRSRGYAEEHISVEPRPQGDASTDAPPPDDKKKKKPKR